MTVTMPGHSRLTCPPLFGTARSPERATLGPRIGEIAAMLGKPPMPHQQLIFDVAGELDPETGLLVYSEVVVIGPRQATGKTELLLPVMTHRCIGFEHAGPQRVLYTTQTTDKAREKWRDIHVERLSRSPLRRMFHSRLQRNSEAMIWANGSMWSPGSTTGKTGGTGDTLDLGVIDEAWSRENNRTELGMRPAMMTRPWRQMWVTSMIPGLSRAVPGSWPYLAHKRQVGRARVEAGVTHGTAFFDFAADEGLDPADPATWWPALPGLGHTVPERAIREDFEAMDLVDFCAEYLGWAPLESRPRWTLVGQDVWRRSYDPGSFIEGSRALAVEVSEDRSAAWIGVAGRRWDGAWHVAVAEPGFKIAPDPGSIGWLEPRLLELVESEKPVTVVIDPRRPAASLTVPLRNRGIDVLTPNQNDVGGACGRFLDALDDDGDQPDLFHVGQPDLDRALAGARKLELMGGAFTFVKKGSASTISPLYAVVLAMHGVDVKGAEMAPEPEIFG